MWKEISEFGGALGFSHEKLYQKALFFGSHGDYIVIEFRCLLRMTTQKAIVYVDSMFKGKTIWLDILRLQSKFNSRISKKAASHKRSLRKLDESIFSRAPIIQLSSFSFVKGKWKITFLEDSRDFLSPLFSITGNLSSPVEKSHKRKRKRVLRTCYEWICLRIFYTFYKLYHVWACGNSFKENSHSSF